MSFEEDTELRDLVIETLEKKGVLGKIKAELRATVFLALEDSDFEKCKIPLRNEALQKFMETNEGLTTVGLVRDFLVTFNLDYTLAVFDPEVSSPKSPKSRRELEDRLNLTSPKNENVPLLKTILEQFKNTSVLNAKESASVVAQDQSIMKFSGPQENSEVETKILNQTINISEKNSNSKNDSEKKESDDNVLKDFVPNAKKEPLLFSFFGGSTVPGKNDTIENLSAKNGNPNHKNETLKPVDNESTRNEEITDLHQTEKRPSLSSLQDLPILGPPKVTKGLDYEEDFQSSLSSHSAKSDNKDGTLPDELDKSIEEEIEEDISVSADDLLNTSSSRGDDTTSDHTVSQLSGKNSDIVYAEKLN